MSVIDAPRTAPAAPAPRSFAHWWDLGVRVVLLAVLLASLVAVLPSLRPDAGTTGRFLADLRAGDVTSVRYESNKVDVLWSDGWDRWYHADLESPLPVLGRSPDGMTPETDGSTSGTAESWVRMALDVTGRNSIDYQVLSGSDQLAWKALVPWHRLSAAAGIAVFAAFVLLLYKGGQRFGNRWAWFWLFAIGGGAVGAVLYLAMEPSPAWRRTPYPRPLPERPALLGGAGFVVALVLKSAIGFAGLALLT